MSSSERRAYLLQLGQQVRYDRLPSVRLRKRIWCINRQNERTTLPWRNYLTQKSNNFPAMIRNHCPQTAGFGALGLEIIPFTRLFSSKRLDKGDCGEGIMMILLSLNILFWSPKRRFALLFFPPSLKGINHV